MLRANPGHPVFDFRVCIVKSDQGLCSIVNIELLAVSSVSCAAISGIKEPTPVILATPIPEQSTLLCDSLPEETLRPCGRKYDSNTSTTLPRKIFGEDETGRPLVKSFGPTSSYLLINPSRMSDIDRPVFYNRQRPLPYILYPFTARDDAIAGSLPNGALFFSPVSPGEDPG
jgi:hypothetical protein